MPRGVAARIRHLYQDILAPENWTLPFQAENDPRPGEDWSLVLDLDRRPRGAFEARDLPPNTFLRVSGAPGTPWRLKACDLDLHQRRHLLRVVPPAGVIRQGNRFEPPLGLTLQLVIDERPFLPFTTHGILEETDP